MKYTYHIFLKFLEAIVKKNEDKNIKKKVYVTMQHSEVSGKQCSTLF